MFRHTPQSLVDPIWEKIDPTPDIRSLFAEFNKRFFWGKLGGVEVKWSKRMTSIAGICSYEWRGGLCSVRISEPLLKLRPRKDTIETLLHEMIHAYLFVTENWRDHDGHGPNFLSHMYRINKEGGTNITVNHTFHREVHHYQVHWWKCQGPCAKRAPHYGLCKRAMNRAPGPNDLWWAQHQSTCGGKFIKIKEPDGFGQKKKGKNITNGAKMDTGHRLGSVTETASTSKSKGIPDYFNVGNKKDSVTRVSAATNHGKQIQPKTGSISSIAKIKDTQGEITRYLPGIGQIPVGAPGGRSKNRTQTKLVDLTKPATSVQANKDITKLVDHTKPATSVQSNKDIRGNKRSVVIVLDSDSEDDVPKKRPRLNKNGKNVKTADLPGKRRAFIPNFDSSDEEDNAVSRTNSKPVTTAGKTTTGIQTTGKATTSKTPTGKTATGATTASKTTTGKTTAGRDTAGKGLSTQESVTEKPPMKSNWKTKVDPTTNKVVLDFSSSEEESEAAVSKPEVIPTEFECPVCGDSYPEEALYYHVDLCLSGLTVSAQAQV